MAKRQRTPKQLTSHNRPSRLAAEVLYSQQYLIARQEIYRVRIPLSARGAAPVPGDRVRDIDAAASGRRAAQPEIDVLKIRSEPLVEQSGLVEQFAPEQRRGHRRETYLARLVPIHRI